MGFALGGPLGALLGAAAGHTVDRARAGGAGMGGRIPQSRETREHAFAVAVIVLGAKMAKADGRVTPNEVAAFKNVFHIPPEEMDTVASLFNEAKRDAQGFEPYARQIGTMLADQPALLEELLGGLFHIAKADGVYHPLEHEFLEQVAREFGFDAQTFERIRASHLDSGEADPYQVLGLTRDATDADIKKTYRKLIREHHPDTLIAKGLPQEFVDVANNEMAAINAAYDEIEKERGLR